MNLSTFNRKRKGNNGEDHAFGVDLSKKQRERIRELQRVWLQTALQIISNADGSQPVVMGVTSADRMEGKTTSCLGLASALAHESDGHVVLVECDIISASLAERLDLDRSPGIPPHGS